MTTLNTERLYGDLENPMTTNGRTVTDPTCSCGANAVIAQGFDVPHKTECYIELAKDAEAVQDAPVRDLGASQPTGQRKRTQVPLPPAEEMEYTRIEWVEGLNPQITELHATGVPHIIKTGSMTGKFDNKRSHEGQNGLMYFGDMTIQSDWPEIHDLGASFSMPTILRKLLENVPLGTDIEIIRKGKVGNAFGFEVYVLD